MISSLLFTNNVSALEFHHIDELELFSQPITEDYLYTTYNVSKETYPYVIMWSSNTSIPSSGKKVSFYVKFFKLNTGIRKNTDEDYYMIKSSNTYTSGFRYSNVGSKIDLSSTDTNLSTGSSGSGGLSEYFYYFSNFDVLSYTVVDGKAVNNDIVSIPANNIVKPSSYTFTETINSLNYSKVEFVFDIPDMETIFNFNYDFHSSDNSTTFKSPYFEETYTSCSTDESGVSSCRPFPLTNNFLIEEGTEENGQCHLDEFGLPNCYKPNDYSNDDEINVSDSYVVSNYDMVLNNDILTKVTSSLKLVLDLEFNSNVIVDVSFTSSLPFDVVYHERTTVSSHYETVDLTGKYGAVFMPKFDITDESLNIRTLFKGTGNLDVQHRSSLDIVNYKILSAYSLNYCNDFLFNQDLIPYSCNEFNGEFEFYVSNSNLEQALFFVNGHYSDDELTEVNVMYDTRYYEYWVFDTPTSIVPITNPNTGVNSYISLEEFYNFAEVDTTFLTDLVNKFLDFFFEKFPVVKQFKMIISLFTYNEDFDDAPVFTVSLDSIGIDKEVQIIDFSIFDQYRSTVIFWEMLFITTITIVKVTENVGKAFKGD